jgi:hypothetical protein
MTMADERLSPTLGSNIHEWARALKEIDPRLAAELNEDRAIGVKKLDELRLPRYKRTSTSLVEFLNHSQEILNNLGSELFYVVLSSTAEELARISKSNVSAQEVINFIDLNVEQQSIQSYDILIQQYFENVYGGCIIVNPNGQVYIEFTAGKQGPIAKGTKTPEYRVVRSEYTGLFKYSFEDENLRAAIYDTLRLIPHYGEGREISYTPGYYEFALVRENESQAPFPVFFDYKNSEAYRLPSVL